MYLCLLLVQKKITVVKTCFNERLFSFDRNKQMFRVQFCLYDGFKPSGFRQICRPGLCCCYCLCGKCNFLYVFTYLGEFSVFFLVQFYLSGVLGRSPRLPRGSGVWGLVCLECPDSRSTLVSLDMFSLFGVVFDMNIYVEDMYF